ncbi:hypothetical protein pdam_00024173, partial [Pocillopora damicornis]
MWEQGHISCGAKSWETKFKNLKRSYIAYIDHNKKTGRNAKKCAYYEELHNIFHGDDDITPSAVYSSRKGLNQLMGVQQMLSSRLYSVSTSLPGYE